MKKAESDEKQCHGLGTKSKTYRTTRTTSQPELHPDHFRLRSAPSFREYFGETSAAPAAWSVVVSPCVSLCQYSLFSVALPKPVIDAAQNEPPYAGYVNKHTWYRIPYGNHEKLWVRRVVPASGEGILEGFPRVGLPLAGRAGSG